MTSSGFCAPCAGVKRNKAGEIVITSDELLRDDELADLFEKKHEIRDTKVKTAISWLERSGFLRRNQNLTDVFQGRPLVQNLDEAKAVAEKLNLAPATQRIWLNIMRLIFNASRERGLSADMIAEAVFPDSRQLAQVEADSGLKPAQIVINALHDMAEAGLLNRGVMLSAILRPKGKNNALKVLQTIMEIENRLLSIMRTEDPDADRGNWVALSVRRLCQKLKNEGFETSPQVIQRLIKGLSYDGKGLAASMGSLELHHISRDRYDVRLQRSWDTIGKTVSLRQNVAFTLLKELICMADKNLTEGAADGGDVNISFSSNDLAAAIKHDIILSASVKKILPAIDRGLMFLHEHKAIHLQGGMAVLRQAMTIRLAPEAKGRRYTLGDFKPLSVHYRERRFQVHVMVAYAYLGLDKIAGALRLVLDYFSLGRIRFINRYFADQKELIEKATTQESYRKIVERLGNPVQIAVVGSPTEQNQLILAGPGAGKTTVIVHRCAHLLQVERIPARQVLVLCFNHNAAITLKKRLNHLIGKLARGLTVATYHGAAMRIAGISVRDVMDSQNAAEIDFDKIIQGALKMINGEVEIAGLEPDAVREQLLGGYSHILVDEYQDIDRAQYDLVSSIAGKSVAEGEGRLSILAVGDDDQNIYAFRGANVEFIRQFKMDYPAQITYLVENYRSSRHIINASNQLIKNNRDRMKGAYPIRINRERENIAPGGKWNLLDPVAQGRVQIVSVKNPFHQAVSVLVELQRLKSLSADFKWDDCAVLSRTRHVLPQVRSVLEQEGHPVKIALGKTLPIYRIREVTAFIDSLKQQADENLRASELLRRFVETAGNGNLSIWNRMLVNFLESYQEETADAMLPAEWALDNLFEHLAEQRQEKIIGDGVFLGTVHSAKGMEFSHVFILDGDWPPPNTPTAREEARRVLYVAMTRAKETLVLMRSAERPNLFLKELTGESILPRKSHVPLSAFKQRFFYRYEILGLEDIYMDYAGGFPKDHSIHRQIANLESGDRVGFAVGPKWVEIHDPDNYCVGRLAAKCAERWKNRFEQIHAVRVVAMLARSKMDPEETYRHRIKTDAWELPVLEVVSRTE